MGGPGRQAQLLTLHLETRRAMYEPILRDTILVIDYRPHTFFSASYKNVKILAAECYSNRTKRSEKCTAVSLVNRQMFEDSVPLTFDQALFIYTGPISSHPSSMTATTSNRVQKVAIALDEVAHWQTWTSRLDKIPDLFPTLKELQIHKHQFVAISTLS